MQEAREFGTACADGYAGPVARSGLPRPPSDYGVVVLRVNVNVLLVRARAQRVIGS